ncbi:Chaperone of endosialidase [Ekhidna lutea]|uniref:Chaperone of endosialidase n=1 Tax=Ekhidna lutea TaxID=447679 RepID=A0A239J0F8_EKHLU|nr:tail fiber domain-containing protein [Ekhidna lutea]SNS99289.1 Chaperone of endosialidase [Ekhidna lutea]
MKKLFSLLLCLAIGGTLLAQKLPFQGRLVDNGKPYSGLATFEFSIASPTWSETIADVNVQDGYYSVVLGESTPLPDTLFQESPEVQMNISVNGEALSPVTLYSSFIPYADGPVQIDTVSSNSVQVLGINDNPKVNVFADNNGYDGAIVFKDSLDRTGAFITTDRGTGTGGYIQLNGRENADGTLKSAVVAGTIAQARQNSFLSLFGGNANDDGPQIMADLYASDIFIDGSQLPDGYRRGGLDLYNYYGNTTHNIFSEHVGTSTISNINLNASQDGGGPQFTLNLNSGDGVSTGGNISLRDVGEVETISLDGSTGTINAQQILIDGAPIEGSGGGILQPDSLRSKSVIVVGNSGETKADLNFFDPNNAGSLVLYGANDSTKVILGSASGGYAGFLGLYDSLRNIGAQLRVSNNGRGNLFTYNESHANVGWFGGYNNDGFAQLVSYDDTETFSGAALIGSFADGNLPEYYIEGSAQENFGLGRFRVTPLGNSAEETARLEINRSNGGGQAVLTIAQDDGGSDPTGTNGILELWGDESINVQIGSEGYEDHDLSSINLYGSVGDGGGWWYNSAQIATRRTGDGINEYGDISLNNNAAGSSNLTAYVSGNYAENGGGGLEFLDSLGTIRVVADGGNGYLSASNTISISRTDGSSAANLFHDGGDGGGISIQNSADFGTLFFGGNEGVLRINDASGTQQISLDGNSGTIDAQQILIQGQPLAPSSGGNIAPDSIETTFIKAFNAAGNEGVYLQGGTEGGTIQLSSPDATNSYNRATFFAGTTSNGENAFANVYGMNPTADGNSILINNYTTTNDVFGNPFSAGYRRGGSDFYDNEGTFLAAIGSNRDEAGGDPSGKSGLVMVNGPTTRNVYVSGQWWDNSELGIVQVFGQNDNGSGDFSSNIEIVADDQAGETSGRISVYNTANGGVVNETIFMTSFNGPSGGSLVELRDSLAITSISMDGQNGNISASGDVSGNTLTSSDGMVQTSDRRLKKNIADLENPLEKTLKMRGVSYQWKDENMSQRNQIGVIAQEVEEIYPEFVHTNDEGMKAVNYAQMTAVLIEAIKELNAKVASLENENNNLKASLEEVKQLRSEMDQLMKMLGNSKAASK